MNETIREYLETDILIVGAGPAGLSAAIKIKQLNADLNVYVIEKAAEVGGHILSGAVIDPCSLTELLPDWKDNNAPLEVSVKQESFYFLTEKNKYKLPIPPEMHNKGNYIISLSNLCKWLAEQAQNLGIEIYPGFPAKELIIENNQIKGVITGDFGIAKNGHKKDSFQAGVGIKAKITLIAEGCRGSLAEKLIKHYDLRKGKQPQTYGIGIKEIWEIPSEIHNEGEIIHSLGWPLDKDTYGGSFIYNLNHNLLSVGFVIGLDYKNPYLSPYEEFQRFKMHPKLRYLFENSKRISYGARALNEGGYQSIPKLIFPGGALIGCSAGFVNVPKIKGIHNAIYSGMIAAKNSVNAIAESKKILLGYQTDMEKSSVFKELKKARNIRPSFKWGLAFGVVYSGLESFIFKGMEPWTFSHHRDNESLINKNQAKKITYPRADGKVSFDRLTSVSLSSTNHEEDQPGHLVLIDPERAIKVNYELYDSPEQRYCPAGVYEIVTENNKPRLQINAQNCVHCKTCDIKDPTQNITWTTPEGGGGPLYSNT